MPPRKKKSQHQCEFCGRTFSLSGYSNHFHHEKNWACNEARLAACRVIDKVTTVAVRGKAVEENQQQEENEDAEAFNASNESNNKSYNQAVQPWENHANQFSEEDESKSIFAVPVEEINLTPNTPPEADTYVMLEEEERLGEGEEERGGKIGGRRRGRRNRGR